jgi:hypothetical protein
MLLLSNLLPLRKHLQSPNIKRKRKRQEVTPEIKMKRFRQKPLTLGKIPSKSKNKKRSIKNKKFITFLLKMRVQKIKTFKN